MNSDDDIPFGESSGPSTRGGAPAFPFQEVGQYGNPTQGAWEGLSKREYFAASALRGLLANPEITGGSLEIFATSASKLATALIHALNKEENECE